jgi:hypothetical protein
MMELFTAWVSALGSTDTLALAAPGAMQLYLTAGWGLVLGYLGAALGARLHPSLRWPFALALMVCVAVPGTYSPDYWMGLAFQAPSGVTVLLSTWLLVRLLWGGTEAAQPLPSVVWTLVGCGIALGYLLMLDTFAVLPWEMYRLGFSPVLLLVMTALGLLLWVRGASAPGAAVLLGVVPVAALLFAATRLYTGNVWDALLDPLLWLVLHGVALRAGYRRLRGTR